MVSAFCRRGLGQLHCSKVKDGPHGREAQEEVPSNRAAELKGLSDRLVALARMSKGAHSYSRLAEYQTASGGASALC